MQHDHQIQRVSTADRFLLVRSSDGLCHEELLNELSDANWIEIDCCVEENWSNITSMRVYSSVSCFCFAVISTSKSAMLLVSSREVASMPFRSSTTGLRVLSVIWSRSLPARTANPVLLS